MNALLIHNPAAGMYGHRWGLRRAVERLKQHGWQVTWRTTEKPADTAAWARQATASDYDVVIVAGGDGTIGQVADGLAGSDIALGIFPLGSGNVLARDLGLPKPGTLHPFALEDAAQLLLDSVPRRVDLGWANGHHFFSWAGVGLDAEIIRGLETQRQVKRRLGLVGFLVFVVLTLRTYAGTRATVLIDGHRVTSRLILALASNIGLYGRYFHIAPAARLNDGLLDVCFFHGQGVPVIFYHAFTVLLRRHIGNPRVSYYQARRVEIETSQPMPVQLDGEPFGTTPLRIEIRPQALTLLLPPKLAEDRFVKRYAERK
ncbi:MAG: diacylglycerol kinase family lipid kinase [Chloroflexi bacterium]|nr:diacylglycerol kinase family lipid kinase [Chloroflexota bacterium]